MVTFRADTCDKCRNASPVSFRTGAASAQRLADRSAGEIRTENCSHQITTLRNLDRSRPAEREPPVAPASVVQCLRGATWDGRFD